MAEALPKHLPPDVNRGPTILAISWVTAGLACVVVALRLYIRLKKHTQGWDDYMIYGALAMVIYGSILNTLQVKHGFGRHVRYVISELSLLSMYTTLVMMQNGIGICLVKISVCVLILRVIEETHPKIRIVLWVTITSLCMITLATVLVICLQCIPLRKVWHPEVPGTCLSKSILTQLIRVLGAIGTATDFLCVLIPTFIIRSLQLNKRTKIAMIGLLELGFFTAACSIGKTVTIETATPDFTWDYVPVEIWAILEENLGVTVASLPVLWPFFAKMLKMATDKLTSGSNRHRTNRSSNTARTFDGQKKSLKNRESDRHQLVPMDNIINVNSTTELRYEQRQSPQTGEEDTWARYVEHRIQ